MKGTIHKLNESYSYIDTDTETALAIYNALKIEKPGAKFDKRVQMGITDEYQYYSFVQNGKLVILNGHISLIKDRFELEYTEPTTKHNFTEAEIDEFYEDVKSTLPFDPYDFQLTAFKESILGKKQINLMCTSSGKSLTISLIVEFFRRKCLKGLLLVPNINLLTQFNSDISDYNLMDLHQDIRVIGGGNTERIFDKTLTISTWQSLQGYTELVEPIDFLICDELQSYASEVTSEIVKSTFGCEFKLGFTGTLPEDPTKKMTLLGLFDFPKTYITARELIDRGLATPLSIHSVLIQYNRDDKTYIRSQDTFAKKLKVIKEHESRNKYCIELMQKLRPTGNTLLLFSHTEHGKGLFIGLMKVLYPDVEVQNKNITGKKSFEFQKQYGVYFLNGEDDAKTRDLTKKILELHSNATIISNYALLSTGVSIKRLHNAILASPLKSYTTITQSLGRGMRMYEGKKVFNIFDVVDNVPPFKGQYKHRLESSYKRERHPVHEFKVDLDLYIQNQEW